jgi:hypothetical protein
MWTSVSPCLDVSCVRLSRSLLGGVLSQVGGAQVESETNDRKQYIIFNFIRLVAGALNVDFMGSTCTALPSVSLWTLLPISGGPCSS